MASVELHGTGLEPLGAALAAASLLGFVSSAHCITMCGPLVIAGCSRQKSTQSTALYIAGRLFSYTSLGALAGGIGGAVLASFLGSEKTRIAVGLLLGISVAWAALHWMRPASNGLLSLRKKPAPPSRWTLTLVRLLPTRGLGLGLATGLFPCGALASALLLSTASGSALRGALSMSAFALASAPALILTAAFGKRVLGYLAGKAWMKQARPIGGVLLLGLAGWLAVTPWLSSHHGDGAGCSCDSQDASIAP